MPGNSHGWTQAPTTAVTAGASRVTPLSACGPLMALEITDRELQSVNWSRESSRICKISAVRVLGPQLLCRQLWRENDCPSPSWLGVEHCVSLELGCGTQCRTQFYQDTKVLGLTFDVSSETKPLPVESFVPDLLWERLKFAEGYNIGIAARLL